MKFRPRPALQRAGPQTGNGAGDHLRGPAGICGAPQKTGSRNGDLAGGSINGAPETVKTEPRKCGAPERTLGHMRSTTHTYIHY